MERRTTERALRAAGAILLGALPILGAPATQDEDPAPAGKEIERLTEWPALDRDAGAEVKKEVARLREARTETMGEEGHAALVLVGDAAAPALLVALGKEKDEEAQARIEAVLDEITGPPHTRLLAAEFTDRSPVVRTWAMGRAALFPDPGTRAAAQAAWKVARSRTEKKADEDLKKPDRDELTAAALALAASGGADGLPYLFRRARNGWKTLGPTMHAALEGLRGEEATAILLPHLDGDRTDLVAALRMLAGCGTRETAVGRLKPFLDSEDTGVRIATINALRGIVDGAPPLPHLSAFDAIERAKEWKRRI